MSYVEGFVVPVPEANREAYRAMAARVATLFVAYGATRVVEGWGDDIPDGKVTDFRRAVNAEAGENVVFAWIEWPSRAVRDTAHPKIVEDEHMKSEGRCPLTASA